VIINLFEVFSAPIIGVEMVQLYRVMEDTFKER
jgi:hypothetical protein